MHKFSVFRLTKVLICVVNSHNFKQNKLYAIKITILRLEIIITKNCPVNLIKQNSVYCWLNEERILLTECTFILIILKKW